MQNKEKIPLEELRQSYAEVLNGRSTMKIKEYGLIYVKHLSIYDTELLDIKREGYFAKAIKAGLPTTEEKIELLEKDDLWSKKREKEIEEQTNFISRMEETKAKLILKSEVSRIAKEIEETQSKIDETIEEKAQLLGLTSELFADKKVNDYYIYLTLYKDPNFKEAFFSEEEFNELSDIELAIVITGYNSIAKSFSEINMKRIALSGFFLNNFYLCKDNPFIFFGKPVVDLTYHQSDLFSYGRYFKHVLSELKNQPPPDVMADPDKLIDQFNLQQNQEKMGGKAQDRENIGGGSTVVGASKEDLEALGMTPDSSAPNVLSLNEEVEKKGGTLDMEDLIKMHGL